MKHFITIFVALNILLSGCSQETVKESSKGDHKARATEKNTQETEPQQSLSKEAKHEMIVNFFNNEVRKVTRLEQSALQAITSGSEENPAGHGALLAELIQSKIPAYEAELKQVESIKPSVEELETLTEQMKLACHTYLEVLKLQKQTLEKPDQKLIQKYNEKLTAYLMLVEDYHYEIEEITEEYNIDFRFNI